MTERELNEVRELHTEIRELIERLNQIREKLTHTPRIMSGMPRAPNPRPKLERLTAELVDGERHLSNLQDRLVTAKKHLTERILDEVNDSLLQKFLILRYVSCLSFKNLARRMKISLRYAYKLHEKIFFVSREFTPCSPPTDVI